MILIQIVLIAALLVLILQLLIRPESHHIRAWKRIIGCLFVVLAVFSVLFPASLNRVANFVGVGRGADLLLYALTLTFIFVTFSLYMNKKRDQRRFAALVRKVAILEANGRYDRHAPMAAPATKKAG